MNEYKLPYQLWDLIQVHFSVCFHSFMYKNWNILPMLESY